MATNLISDHKVGLSHEAQEEEASKERARKDTRRKREEAASEVGVEESNAVGDYQALDVVIGLRENIIGGELDIVHRGSESEQGAAKCKVL